MDKKLLKDCIGAVIEAAVEKGWDRVLDLTLNDVVEQLEQSEVQTPEQAVMLFADWVDVMEMNEISCAERAAYGNGGP